MPGGSNLIFSTRDELSTVGLMQPTRPRQFGAASAGAESKWRAGAAAPERAAHAVLRRKNGARAFRWAMQALPFSPRRSQNYSFGSDRRFGDSHLLAYFFSIAAMKPSARNPSIRLISM